MNHEIHTKALAFSQIRDVYKRQVPALTPEAFAEEDNAEAEDFDFDDLELGDDDLNLDDDF